MFQTDKKWGKGNLGLFTVIWSFYIAVYITVGHGNSCQP